MEDRFTNGFIAGLIGGIGMSILNLLSYYLGIAEVLYSEWGSVLVLGHRHATVTEALIGQASQLFFAAINGVLFAYLIAIISNRYYYFKGWVFGLVVWFGSYVITILYKLTPLTPLKPDTVISNIVTASVYGLVLAWSLLWLTLREKAK
ncbi:MAG TPA: hypothetical protein GX697_02455 [Firmicutes bacterium]|nr:hypothetical protein [Bacillota bacterium]